MQKDKISVIIPVYNVEKYVEESVLSIMNQSLKEIEIMNEPYSLSQLKINGDDLLKLGIKDKQIKITLENLLTLVIEHPEFNDEIFLKEQVTK